MGFIVHEELMDMMVDEGVIDVFADIEIKILAYATSCVRTYVHNLIYY